MFYNGEEYIEEIEEKEQEQDAENLKLNESLAETGMNTSFVDTDISIGILISFVKLFYFDGNNKGDCAT